MTFLLTRIHVVSFLLCRCATRTGILLTPADRRTANVDYWLEPATSRWLQRLREGNDGGSRRSELGTILGGLLTKSKWKRLNLALKHWTKSTDVKNITKGRLRGFRATNQTRTNCFFHDAITPLVKLPNFPPTKHTCTVPKFYTHYSRYRNANQTKLLLCPYQTPWTTQSSTPMPSQQQLAGHPQTFLLSNTTDSNFTLWLLLVFLPEARRLGRMCRSLFKRRGEKHVKRHILKQNKAAEIYKPICTR